MEEEYISISTLNDFIFCPYSIYLHNVYENTDKGSALKLKKYGNAIHRDKDVVFL